MDAINTKLAAAKPNGHDPLEIVAFADMLTPDLESRPLVKGVINKETVVLIFGESGCGKTFFTLDLALHIAAEGIDWFGRRTTAGRVVYVAAEAGRSIKNRVAAFAQEKWDERAEVDFRAVVSPVDLCHPKSWDVGKLVAAIGSADLVIVDTVSRALAGGNENAPDDMGAFVTALDQLRSKLGCTVIAVHHVGKDASRGGRGHSLLHCAVDTEIEVERRDEIVSVATVTKQRDGAGGIEIAFLLRSVNLGLDQDGDPVTSCVVEPTDYVPEAKTKGPSGQAKFALAALNQAFAEKGEYIPGDGNIEVRAVRIDTWREYAERSTLLGDGQKFRTAWHRVQAKLDEGGHISLRDGYAWPTRPLDDTPPF